MDERLAKAIAILRTNLGNPVNPEGERTNMTTTYTRLNNGAWGLRSNGAIAPGQQVQVTTRDGRVKTETVGSIVWSRDGVTVASTARADAQTQTETRVTPAPVVREMPAARVQTPVAPDSLDRLIADLETALAGLKALKAAA